MNKKQPGMPDLIQTAYRLPPSLIEDLDAMAAERNEAVGWAKFSRSDVVRDVLQAAADEWRKKRKKKR